MKREVRLPNGQVAVITKDRTTATNAVIFVARIDGRICASHYVRRDVVEFLNRRYAA